MPNYIQPNTGNPAPNPAVVVQPHQLASAGGNPMALTWPVPRHVEKLSDKDDPQGTGRAGKSGKGGPG
jgi:hypothetical protein